MYDTSMTPIRKTEYGIKTEFSPKIMDLHCFFIQYLRQSWNVVAFRREFARKDLKLEIATGTLNSVAFPVNPKWSLF
jgi:hypothetical protein